MGEPKRYHKLREHPKKPKARLSEEEQLVRSYAIKTKRAIHGVRYQLRRMKLQAKRLLAASEREETHLAPALLRERRELLERLDRINLISLPSQSLEDVLGLSESDLFDKHLITVVLKKHFATTAKQARQMIVHGHVLLRGRAITIPSYVPTTKEHSELTLREGSLFYQQWKQRANRAPAGTTEGKNRRRRSVEPVGGER